MSAPVDTLMHEVVKDLKRNGVTKIVRTCAKTYNDDEIRINAIEIEDLQFPDGRGPPNEVISKWLKIVHEHFFTSKTKTPLKPTESHLSPIKATQANQQHSKKKLTENLVTKEQVKGQDRGRIAVHCIAGLGRAPLLVAIAMINQGCEPEKAIAMIRAARPGAINQQQALFLMKYKNQDKCNIL